MRYGGTGTIHGTTHLDVEVFDGKVVSVWFRCMTLPFKIHEVSYERAASMSSAYEKQDPKHLVAVEVEDTKPDWKSPSEVMLEAVRNFNSDKEKNASSS